MIAPRQSRLVAVVGGSGAGKSWFIQRICELLGEKAGHLQLDDFYRDRSKLPLARRARVNFDEPRAIDWRYAERVLLDCRAGHSTELPRYDFATHCRIVERATWEPRPIVFVDGLWLLRRPDLRQLFDLKVYLDTPHTLRRDRRLARDVRERGYSQSETHRRFQQEVLPMHHRYVEPQKRYADIVLSQPFVEGELAVLADRLWTLVETASPLPPWMHETFRAELLSALSPHEIST
jgi:uridine kinase